MKLSDVLRVGIGIASMIALAVLGYPIAQDYLTTDVAAGGANRGLIVMTTSGGLKDTTLRVEQIIEGNAEMRLVFYFTSPNVDYSESAPSRPIDYTISFIGADFVDQVTCADGDLPAGTTYENLNAGTKRAIAADISGGRASASNFEGSDTQGAKVLTELQGGPISERSGTLYTFDKERRNTKRSTSGDSVWAEECRIGAPAWRRDVDSASQLTSSRFTILPLQINWAGKSNKTDVQYDVISRTHIDRTDEIQLREAYPPLPSYDSSWSYQDSGQWVGNLGEEGNFGFTDQPVFIFGDRSLEDSKALSLTVIGLAFGLFSTILVGVVSKLLDLFD